MSSLVRFSFFVAAVWIVSGCQSGNFDAERYAELNQRYDVVIRRDVRGVPHVLGATDPDHNPFCSIILGHAAPPERVSPAKPPHDQ